MTTYVTGYELPFYGEYKKLPGAETHIQAKIDSLIYWYSIGVQSEKENQQNVWRNLSGIGWGELVVFYHLRPVAKVRVVYPNGGETFISGSVVNIQWQAEDSINYYYPEWVKLWYVMDGVEDSIGQKNNTNQYNPWTEIYPWTVPNVDQVKDVKIKVLAHFSDPESTEKVDYSDDFFRIGPPDSIRLIWPNSQGIVIEEGTTRYVRYDGISSAGIKDVKARFSPNGGQTWTNHIGSHDYSQQHPLPTEVFDDSIQWNVAEQPTLEGRLKLVLTDANNQTAEDISDYDFELKPARPGGLSAVSSSPYTSVNLSWTNNSAYADGYEVHRKVMDGTWKFLQDVSTTSYTDNSVSRYYDYWYKINTYTNTQNEKIYSYFSNERWGTTSPLLAIDNASVAKSGGKGLIRVGTRLHAVYSQSGKIYYRYSDDNGLTWSTPEYIGNGVTPVICADGDNNLWVAWARDTLDPYREIFYAKKINTWEIHEISGICGFNPVIVYGAPSSYQPEGVYIGFEDYKPESRDINPYTDIYLYRVNVNNPGSYTQVGYYRLSDETGITTDLTIGKVSYDGEDWVLLIYSNPGDFKLYCIEGVGGSPFGLQIEYDAVYGESPSFGNSNLLCFKAVSPFWNAPGITVAKFDNSQGVWMYYPNRNSQSQYTDGNNPQIMYLSSAKTIVYEKSKEVYLQPISNTPDDPVLLTSMPDFSQNLYPHLTLRGGLFTYAQIIYPFADTIIYKERKLPSSTPLVNPNGGTQGAGDNFKINFSLKVNPAIITKNGIFEIGIPEQERVQLLIYDITGSVVKKLMSGRLSRGIYRFSINSENFAEGVYLVVLKGEKQKTTTRFMIVK